MFAKSVPMPIVIGALKRLDMIRTKPALRERLWENVRALQGGLKEAGFDIGNTESCVTPVYIHAELGEAVAFVYDMREKYGIFCSIVVYPVIPKGMVILRLIPTAVHTQADIDETIAAFKALKSNLESGAYKAFAEKYMESVS
jgi:glycine C-acetyltransferase